MAIRLGTASSSVLRGTAVNVLDYGADPTGVADSASAIQRAVNGAQHVYFPSGTYLVAATITVPSNRVLSGVGYASCLTANGDYPVITLANADSSIPENVSLEQLRLAHTNTVGPAVLQGSSYGVSLWGHNILLVDLWLVDCFSAVVLATEETNYSQDIRLERVYAEHSGPSANGAAYGLQVNTVSGIAITDCVWQDAWLDGIKLRKLCTDVRISGGACIRNGRGYGYGTSGDGIDMFAGAENVSVDGTVFANNGGNGVVIKTVGNSVSLGYDFNPSWGWMRNISLSNVTCRGNIGHGIAIEGVYNSTSTYSPTLVDADEDNRPRASNIHITDPTIEGNGLMGIFVNGLHCNVDGGTIRNCQREGLTIAENARYVDVRNTTILGCSKAAVGDYPAVTTQSGARFVRFSGLRMNGKDHGDSVEIVDDSSYAGLTTYHRNGIEVLAGAEDIEVVHCTNQYVTSDPYESPAVVFGDNRVLVQHSLSDQSTGNSRFYGGRGSTVVSRTYGTDGTTLWLKESAASSKSGWVPVWGRKHYAQITASGVTSNLTCTEANTYYWCRAFDTNTTSYGATADAASDRIVLAAGAAGKYRVSVMLQWKSDIGEEWEFSVRADNVPIGNTGYGRADVGSAVYQTAWSFIATLAASDVIDVACRNKNTAGEVITFTAAVLEVDMLEKTI